MNINRNNYEEYFILYLDNELESEDRCQVEAFAQENPDLKAELDMLLQSKLVADTDISFTDKGSLMRFDSSSISLSNYEVWLTSYIDNELTEEERKDVERFVAGNPVLQKELSLLQQTILQPEAIVFPNKESLYRREEKARVVAIRWWRIAAAAVLLLGISTTAIVLLNNKQGGKQDDLAKEQSKKEKSTIDTPVKQPGEVAPVNQEAIAKTDQKKTELVIKENNPVAIKDKNTSVKEKNKQPVQVKKEEPVIAIITKDVPPDNNLPQPDNNPYVKGQADQKTDIVASTNTPAVTLTIPPENKDVTVVTPGATHTSQLSTPDNEVGVAEKSSGNKGLRGFFRKITRTFEKRTNIKATDDDDRLLIAGLAIKMN